MNIHEGGRRREFHTLLFILSLLTVVCVCGAYHYQYDELTVVTGKSETSSCEFVTAEDGSEKPVYNPKEYYLSFAVAGRKDFTVLVSKEDFNKIRTKATRLKVYYHYGSTPSSQHGIVIEKIELPDLPEFPGKVTSNGI